MLQDWSPLWLSLRDAALATVLALFSGLPLAWFLARRRAPAYRFMGAILLLPLLLPLGETNPTFLGVFLQAAPLFILLARHAFLSLDPLHENTARTLGASEWRVFAQVAVPLAGRALLLATGGVFGLLTVARLLAPSRS
jgi:ABC-type molybdate transport system permease subunit